MSAGLWYVRSKGKVFGPFDESQLEGMRRRGSLARFDEVSQDRVLWLSAEELNTVSNPRSQSQAPSAAPVDTAAPVAAPLRPDDQTRWYYAKDGATVGPVSGTEIDRLVATGVLSPVTQVWREGMPKWAFYADTRGAPPAPASADRPGQANSPVLISVQSGPAPHGHLSAEPYARQLPRTSGLAIASLVLGLLVLCGIGSTLAIIFGSVAIGQINRSRGMLEGKGMAIAGLVLGILGVSFLVILWLRVRFF